MANYYLDLGFDWWMQPILAGGSSIQLQDYLVDAPSDAIASYFDLQIGDELTFRIFDVTGDPRYDPSVVSATFLFQGARPTDPPSPLAETTAAWNGQDLTASAAQQSPAFGGVTGTMWTPNPNDPFVVSVAGRFLFSATIYVTNSGETRVFRVDPEMIVGGSEGG